MKKIAYDVAFFPFAISGTCVFAGGADTPALRLFPTKIPKGNEAK